MSLITWIKRILGIVPGKIVVPHSSPLTSHTPPLRVPIASEFIQLKPADASRDSIAELLSQVAELQTKRAAWPEIWATLNPNHDPQVQGLLIELRGPHMFVPYIALNALEEGCQRVARTHLFADKMSVLKAALDSCNRIIRDN